MPAATSRTLHTHYAVALLAAATLPLTARATGLPAPQGLRPCPAGDRVASIESNLAARIHGDLLGCFRSTTSVPLSGRRHSPSVPLEYGFAMRLPGGPYASNAVDQLLASVRAQWSGFKPLDGALSSRYSARINELLNGRGGVRPGAVSVTTIKPVLVSIHRLGPTAYSVVSLRTYRVAVGSRSVRAVKIDADALVLDHGTLVRLTLLREARAVPDVAATQAQIAAWARSLPAPARSGPHSP